MSEENQSMKIETQKESFFCYRGYSANHSSPPQLYDKILSIRLTYCLDAFISRSDRIMTAAVLVDPGKLYLSVTFINLRCKNDITL